MGSSRTFLIQCDQHKRRLPSGQQVPDIRLVRRLQFHAGQGVWLPVGYNDVITDVYSDGTASANRPGRVLDSPLVPDHQTWTLQCGDHRGGHPRKVDLKDKAVQTLLSVLADQGLDRQTVTEIRDKLNRWRRALSR